jgi:hypothetical protein
MRLRKGHTGDLGIMIVRTSNLPQRSRPLKSVYLRTLAMERLRGFCFNLES